MPSDGGYSVGISATMEAVIPMPMPRACEITV